MGIARREFRKADVVYRERAATADKIRKDVDGHIETVQQTKKSTEAERDRLRKWFQNGNVLPVLSSPAGPE